MATIRKRIPGLVVVLLILALTGQAAAAFVMPCRATASCCCRSAAVGMDMAGPMKAGMTHQTRPSCCETTPYQPCDIASDPHPARMTFLTTAFIDRMEEHAPAGLAVSPSVSAGLVSSSRYERRPLSGRGDPPIYLVVQTILC